MQSFAIAQDVDRAFVGPIALGYKKRVPEPVRDALRNFVNNLHEPDVFLNFLLQIHPGKAAETLGRFAINTTIGGAGLVDVAKRRPFRLPRRPNGFGDTMGYYGVKAGPFLFLPLIGATSLRDAIGGGLDRLVLPLAVGAPFNQLSFTIPIGAVSALDHRIDFDERLNALRTETSDPYVARRALYLRERQAEIDALHFGHPRSSSVASELGDPAHGHSMQPALRPRPVAGSTQCGRSAEATETPAAPCALDGPHQSVQ